MKKTVIIVACSILMVIFSCKKSTEGNKSIIKQENGYSMDLPKDTTSVPDQISGSESEKEYTERYVAEDGSSALITFKNADKEKTISIRSNNKTISAPQKEAYEKGGVYGNFDITIKAKNDSITISQNDNVIILKKARGQ